MTVYVPLHLLLYFGASCLYGSCYPHTYEQLYWDCLHNQEYISEYYGSRGWKLAIEFGWSIVHFCTICLRHGCHCPSFPLSLFFSLISGWTNLSTLSINVHWFFKERKFYFSIGLPRKTNSGFSVISYRIENYVNYEILYHLNI